MKYVFAACAMLALASPAFARDADATARSDNAGISQDMVGQSIVDSQNHKIGTVERFTTVNGKDAAIVRVEHGTSENVVAIKTTDLQLGQNGKGLTVAMSNDKLFSLPAYAPGSAYALE